MGNEKFKFEEESPNISHNLNNINKIPIKEITTRSTNKVILEPKSVQIIKLSIPKSKQSNFNSMQK